MLHSYFWLMCYTHHIGMTDANRMPNGFDIWLYL